MLVAQWTTPHYALPGCFNRPMQDAKGVLARSNFLAVPSRVRRVNDGYVLAGAAIDAVVPPAVSRNKPIVASTAAERVRTTPSHENIVSGASIQRVESLAADDVICAKASVNELDHKAHI